MVNYRFSTQTQLLPKKDFKTFFENQSYYPKQELIHIIRDFSNRLINDDDYASLK